VRQRCGPAASATGAWRKSCAASFVRCSGASILRDDPALLALLKREDRGALGLDRGRVGSRAEDHADQPLAVRADLAGIVRQIGEEAP